VVAAPVYNTGMESKSPQNAKDRTMKKITKATFKAFVKKHREELCVRGSRSSDGGFAKAKPSTLDQPRHTRGITGVWLVGGGRDFFAKYEDDLYTGISVGNCCGCFIVAIRK